MTATKFTDNQTVLYHAHIDYLRQSKRTSDQLWRNDFEDMSKRIQQQLKKAKIWQGMNKIWSFMNYRGWRDGSIAFGGRETDMLLQVSGPLAEDALLLLKGLNWGNCSRIDYSVTYWCRRDPDEIIKLVKDKYRRWKKQNDKTGPKSRYEDCDGDGDTLYIGARGGEIMTRWYNKGKESNNPLYENCLRVETEYGGTRAIQARDRALAADDLRERVLGTVKAEMARFGISMPPARPVGGDIVKSMRKVRTDAESTLRWYAEQVRPSIERMLLEGFTRGQLATILGLEAEAPKYWM